MEEKLEIKDQIIREMTKSIKIIGGRSDILGTVCSYGETLPDETVLSELRYFNSITTPY